MIELIIFWNLFGGILVFAGFYLIEHKNKKKDFTVLGIAFLDIGILIIVGSELYIYINGI